MKATALLVVTVCLVAGLNVVESLKCYRCDSVHQPNCMKPKEHSNVPTCNSGKQCSTVTSTGARTTVVRDCISGGQPSTCSARFESGTRVIVCSCSTELCNHSLDMNPTDTSDAIRIVTPLSLLTLLVIISGLMMMRLWDLQWSSVNGEFYFVETFKAKTEYCSHLQCTISFNYVD